MLSTDAVPAELLQRLVLGEAPTGASYLLCSICNLRVLAILATWEWNLSLFSEALIRIPQRIRDMANCWLDKAPYPTIQLA